MSIKNTLHQIDKFIVSYFGLTVEKDNFRAIQVENTGKNIVIRGTSCFKRHILQTTWEHFKTNHLSQLNPKQQEKLGKAIGQSIAHDLTVSFSKGKMV